MYCEVYLFDAPYHIDRAFDYYTDRDICVGDIVRVPFGRQNKLRMGVVALVKDKSEGMNIKPVHSVLSARISFTEEMLGLCLFLKEHTLCTFGEAAKAILPRGALSENLNIKYSELLSLAVGEEETEKLLFSDGKGRIKSEGQREILRYLRGIGSADREIVKMLPGVTAAHIAALIKKGILTSDKTELYRNPYEKYFSKTDTEPIVLSRAQRAAYGVIEKLYLEDKPRCALLHGITGSGKTKIIMSAIDKAVAEGKKVIMMVPEIALTPQTLSIFCSRYGRRVATIHSSLSQGERLDAWRRIRDGGVDVVIGTRSAVLAPLDNIGLIIMDEEHEHTYKSESDPKYHARDVAAYRCARHNALLLLASATPSLESFYKAKSGIYTLIQLKERYGGFELPEAVIVDMREEIRLGNVGPISDRLLKELQGCQSRDEQGILFLNRRGYNSQISCKKCGEVLSCPRCSVSLTYHVGGEGKLMCHMCGYTQKLPKACPECGGTDLSFLGFGTQKVEGELSRYLPDMTVMRMDADTTTGKLSYDRMLEDFREGKADILLGTQMVAKGHDFPRVTLVGVVLADTSLYVSDFRAAERTFSLLTQVIGRAGRAGPGGRAVIQTYSPKNEIIKLACLQDYDSFYEGEIAIRKELSYPPFCDIVTLTLTSEDEAQLMRSSVTLSEFVLERLNKEYNSLPFVVFGPFEAQVYKINSKFRMKMIFKCKLNSKTRAFFRECLEKFALCKDVNLSADMNPFGV